jgi:hypothetical protein
VRAEIIRNIQESKGGPDAQYAAELKAERAEDAAQLAQDKALLTAEGSVPEKQAQARIASADERDAAFIARAELNKVKAKIRELENSKVAWQAVLKSIQAEGA